MKIEAKDSSKASNDDPESTMDKFTPSTSPFLEVKDFSLQMVSSPMDSLFNRAISYPSSPLPSFPPKILLEEGSIQRKPTEELRSMASVDQQPSFSSLQQKQSIEFWDPKGKAWGLPRHSAKNFEMVLGARKGWLCTRRSLNAL